MIVTIFELDYKDRRTIHSIENRHEMHRDIQRLFNEGRNTCKTIYRITERKGKLLLYLYSEKPVDKTKVHFGMNYLGEGTVPYRQEGEYLNIDMLVTPIKTIQCSDGRKRKRPIFNAEKRIAWCIRKAEENGFLIKDIKEIKKEPLVIDKHNGQSAWIVDAYEYKLRAIVEDAKQFNECMINGFGRNASYGAGMIIIA